MPKQFKKRTDRLRGERRYNHGQKKRIHGIKGQNHHFSHKNKSISKFKEDYEEMEGYILYYSDYKQDVKYVSKINRVSEYVGEEYKQVENVI